MERVKFTMMSIINNDGINTDRITIAGWKIEGGAENSLVFRRDDATGENNQPFFRMAQDGNLWVSRSTQRGWVSDNIKDHTHQYWAPGTGGYKAQTWKTGDT
jgi:hypothetical protein